LKSNVSGFELFVLMAKSKKNIPKIVVTPPPGGKARRRRRQRQRKRENQLALVKATGRSANRLRGLSSDGATFMRAALDPFSDVQLRSVGVPDSFAGNTLKHVNTMTITVVPDATGTISFVMLPSVSHPIIPIVGTFNNVSLPVIDKVTLAPFSTTTINWTAAALHGTGYGAIPWPFWAQSYILGSSILGATSLYGPYGYRSQRIVSQGLEWRYTGTTLSDQGVATAALLDSYTIDGYTEGSGLGTVNPLSTDVEFIQRADLSTLLRELSQGNLSNQPNYIEQTLHTSEGAGGMLVMIPSEEGYVMKPYAPNTAIIDATSKMSLFNAAGGTFLGGAVVTNDTSPVQGLGQITPWQNLRPIGVSITGLNTTAGTASIVLRLKQRVEATVDISSAFQQFTDKSPAEDCQAMSIVADVSKTLPVMVPVTMNGFGDWWRKIMSVISSAGKIAGGLGIPFVSPIAGGVGALADVLGSL